MLMVRANQPGKNYDNRVESYIDDYNIGGVTFFAGDPVEQVKVTNEWQANAKVPLLISIDAEWGLGMRIKEAPSFPYQMTLGAIREDTLMYLMGLEIGRQCKRMGIQMNFAPVVDINSNPGNPIINMRSFGQERENVAKKGIAYMKGLQDAGILTVAKHFPGHGDTDTDSHLTLPVINHTKAHLDSLELYPFRKLIEAGTDGVMIAHLYIPGIDSGENVASTLSPATVTGLLKEELGFEGLVITDALDMKGVTGYHEPGDIEVKALLAGNDILLLPENVPVAVSALLDAVEEGAITEQMIDERCRKILRYKHKAGLALVPLISHEGLVEELNSPASKRLNMILAEQAVTLLKNENQILPLKRIDTLKIATLSNRERASAFHENLDFYAETDDFFLPGDPGNRERSRMLEELDGYDLIIVSLFSNSPWNVKDFGVSQGFIDFLGELSHENTLVLDVFGSPYLLSRLDHSSGIEAIVMSYQSTGLIESVSAQMIFGGIPFRGRLPVAASYDFPQGTGLDTDKIRLQYASYERLGISEEYINRADSIIREGIEVKAFPGCQVLAARDGIVFYNKPAGRQTYSGNNIVTGKDIYDVASLTKIAATMLTVMSLQEQGLIDVDLPLSYYLPYLKKSHKKHVIIREMLAHQARFRNWIPYYQYTLKEGKPDPAVFSDKLTETHSVRVAEGLYISEEYRHVIVDSILNSQLRDSDDYLYSDLGYYLLKDAIEQIVNQPFDRWLDENFYKPMGLFSTGFHPRQKWELNRIVPTEDDRQFRKQLVHGDVHDQGAALLGGVSGHAGLFSTAGNLAAIMQMLLNGGEYGGVRYLEPGTIKQFTKRQFPLNGNRRGIGFDKPLVEYEEDGPNCKSASPSSFGHSGFTGTYMWADPKNGLVYVFLSNRIYPDPWNNKISKLNIRTNLHQVFYDAIEKSGNFAGF